MEPLEIDVFVYDRSKERETLGWWMLVGGAWMIVVALLGFSWALFRRVDQMLLHGLSTLPMVLAVGLLSGWWTLCRGPRRVTIDGAGLQIEQRGGTRKHLWSELGWATIASAGMTHQRSLVVYDQTGRQLASLSEAFQNFDELVSVVKSRLADQPAEIVSGIQARKARKSALFLASFATVMLFVSGAVAWFTYDEQRAAKLLATDGIEGVATIDRLFLAPNGVTTRVEYTVRSEQGGTGSRNAEIEPSCYAELQRANATSIPVVFVPAEPAISRLRNGEVIAQDFTKTPLGGYGLSGLVALMCLGFLATSVLQWYGWDIDLDSKTGKISIQRYGEGK